MLLGLFFSDNCEGCSTTHISFWRVMQEIFSFCEINLGKIIYEMIICSFSFMFIFFYVQKKYVYCV